MKHRYQILQDIEASGIVAVIRADSVDQTIEICEALLEGGILSWEITMTTPGALRAIERVADRFGNRGCPGVGTVLDTETAVAAIHAGAQFVFSPIVNPAMIEAVHRYDRIMVPGGLTPTEIATAWAAGADLVKVFPANHFGPGYFKDLKGPLPQVRLTPTGGVDLTTAADWINAGAVALGVGSSLVKKDLVAQGNWRELSQLAAQYVKIVADTRNSMTRKG